MNLYYDELVSDQGVWFFTMELVDGETFVHAVTGISETQARTLRRAAVRREHAVVERREPNRLAARSQWRRWNIAISFQGSGVK